MGVEFHSVELGEVASVRSGFAFKSGDWTEGGIPVVKIANVKDGRLVMDGCSYVSKRVASSAAEFSLEPGDILIAMTGYIGDVALVRKRDLPAVLNQRVGRFSVSDPRRLDKRFLFYLLRGNDVRKEIEGLGYGSAQPNVSPSLIQRVLVPLPSVPEQRAIAAILGALDDKIELNRKMSATLEAMARALFKSWFVDFDPVRAKAEGRDTGLPSEIATLFPDSFEKSELGEIPKGWLASKIGKHLETVLGGTPDRGNAAFWNSGNIAWINSGKVNEFRIIEPTARITQDALEHSAAKVLPPRTTVLAITGATLGQVSLLEIPSAANQSVVGILGTGQIPSEYIYNWISERIDDLVKRQTGGAQQHVNRNDVNDLAIIVPPAQIMDAYGGIARPVFDRIKLACLESKTLSTLRNTLLPKLISGDIRVPDAQRFVETFA